MQPDASAYVALGLRPGDGPVAIEEAYRRLIKLNHPDRGGSPARAAEINSAYQHLRSHFGDALGGRRGPPVPVRPPRPLNRRRTHGWALLLIAGIAVLSVSQSGTIGDMLASLSFPIAQPLRHAGDARARAMVDLAEAPLDLAAIDRSVLEAALIESSEGEERLGQQSLACHRQMRLNPDPSRLDRCVAFDEAAVTLLGRDPFDAGPFGASAMTARHFASGHLLSNDMLAVESRLNRIRAQVELSLAPPDLPAPPVRASAN